MESFSREGMYHPFNQTPSAALKSISSYLRPASSGVMAISAVGW